MKQMCLRNFYGQDGNKLVISVNVIVHSRLCKEKVLVHREHRAGVSVLNIVDGRC